MQFHLDRALRLHTEPQYKNLYSWAINEVLEDGQTTGRDQIPWVWTLYFTATECALNDSLSIEPDYTVHSDSYPPKASERQSIRMRLHPGIVRDDGDYWRQTRFSMFGTDRIIKDLFLHIYEITNPDEQEYCKAWGCVSYTSEVDFRDETQDDTLLFNLFVKPQTFARYAEIIRAGSIDKIIFNAGRVSGFYSDWSPSISTHSVKVLTSDKEQRIENTAEQEIDPPRLGDVGQCALHINRLIAFKKQEVEEAAASDQAAENRRLPVEREAPATVIGADPQIRQLLQSLKTAALWV